MEHGTASCARGHISRLSLYAQRACGTEQVVDAAHALTANTTHQRCSVSYSQHHLSALPTCAQSISPSPAPTAQRLLNYNSTSSPLRLKATKPMGATKSPLALEATTELCAMQQAEGPQRSQATAEPHAMTQGQGP
eukprot:364456-Chlamydomonas_euryale.AAC.3